MTDLTKCQVLHTENNILVYGPEDFVNAEHHTHGTAAKHAIEKYSKYTTEGMLYIVDKDGVSGFECNNIYNIALPVEKHSCFVFTSRDIYNIIDKDIPDRKELYEHICKIANIAK